jgi:hypothetical protein
MKISAILKKAVFIWGIVSIGFVIVMGAWILVQLRLNSLRNDVKEETKIKKFGTVELKILGKYGKTPIDIYLSLADSGKMLLDNYHLPLLSELGITYVDIDSASIRTNPTGDVRIILFSRHDECDSETRYLWFIKKTSAGVNVIKVLDLHDLRITEPGKDIFWGCSDFTLEYVKDMSFEPYTLPVEVRVDDKIHVTPLLSGRGLELLRQSYESEVSKRIAIVQKNKDTKALQNIEADLALFRELSNGTAYDF